jgi:hypothetical protein
MANRGEVKSKQKVALLNRVIKLRVRAYLNACKMRCIDAEAAYLTARALA